MFGEIKTIMRIMIIITILKLTYEPFEIILKQYEIIKKHMNHMIPACGPQTDNT